jgi:hypothetical protein
MTVQEQIDKIAAEAKAKIDELVKLQKQDEPQPGDWCVFWDDLPFDKYGMLVNKLMEITYHGYYKDGDSNSWKHCRRITPEDFGWKLDNKPGWKNAPDWAKYLAQDENGSWWFFSNEPKPLQTLWNNDGLDSLKSNVKNHNWRETLESRPK